MIEPLAPQNDDMLTSLACMRCGESGTILVLEGGCECRSRLSSMGLAVGCPVRVLSGDGTGGRMVVCIGDTRLALGDGMARNVFVATDN